MTSLQQSDEAQQPASPLHSRNRQAALTLAALGIVYGDIGTSPLYAVRESVLAVAGIGTQTEQVLGVLSLIFWSLIVVVTIKYVGIVLRASNNGEGGVLALAQLAHRSPNLGRTTKSAIVIGGVLGFRCSTATVCSRPRFPC